MRSSRMMVMPLVVVLVMLAKHSCGQRQVLTALNAGTPEGRQELIQLLRADNIPFVVRCLSDPTKEGCDRRIRIVRNLVTVLSQNEFQCRVCSQSVQEKIDTFRNAIQNNPAECMKLEEGLQLSNLC